MLQHKLFKLLLISVFLSFTFSSEEDFILDKPKEVPKLQFLLLMNVNFGTPSQSFKLHVDTGSEITWIHNKYCVNCDDKINKFDEEKSNTLINLKNNQEINYGIGSASGFICNDIIELSQDENKLTTNINFMLANKSTKSLYDGILAVGRVSSNESILYNLYKKTKIQYEIFNFYFDSQNKKWISAFGGYPKKIESDILNGNLKLKSCNLYPNHKKWICSAVSLSFKGIINPLYPFGIDLSSEQIGFDSGASVSILSEYAFTKLKLIYFMDYLNKKQCIQVKSEPNGFDVILCKKEVISNFRTLLLNFGKSTMELKIEDIFLEIKNETYIYQFVFFSYSNMRNINIIGMNILDKYYVILNKSYAKIEFIENFNENVDLKNTGDNKNIQNNIGFTLGNYFFYNEEYLNTIIEKLKKEKIVLNDKMELGKYLTEYIENRKIYLIKLRENEIFSLNRFENEVEYPIKRIKKILKKYNYELETK